MDQDRVRRLPPIRAHLIVRDNRPAQKVKGAVIRKAVNIDESHTAPRRLERGFMA